MLRSSALMDALHFVTLSWRCAAFMCSPVFVDQVIKLEAVAANRVLLSPPASYHVNQRELMIKWLLNMF